MQRNNPQHGKAQHFVGEELSHTPLKEADSQPAVHTRSTGSQGDGIYILSSVKSLDAIINLMISIIGDSLKSEYSIHINESKASIGYTVADVYISSIFDLRTIIDHLYPIWDENFGHFVFFKWLRFKYLEDNFTRPTSRGERDLSVSFEAYVGEYTYSFLFVVRHEGMNTARQAIAEAVKEERYNRKILSGVNADDNDRSLENKIKSIYEKSAKECGLLEFNSGKRFIELRYIKSFRLIDFVKNPKYHENLVEKHVISAHEIAQRALNEPEFAQALAEAFVRAAVVLPISQNPKSPSAEPTDSVPAHRNERLEGDASLSVDLSGLPLPDQAPRLWADRDSKTERNPAEFIRLTYHHWLKHRVLRRQDVGQLDDALGKAYSQWIRPERHPEDAIDFAPGNPGGKIEDPKEAIERRRESTRKAVARHRANKAARASSQP